MVLIRSESAMFQVQSVGGIATKNAREGVASPHTPLSPSPMALSYALLVIQVLHPHSGRVGCDAVADTNSSKVPLRLELLHVGTYIGLDHGSGRGPRGNFKNAPESMCARKAIAVGQAKQTKILTKPVPMRAFSRVQCRVMKVVDSGSVRCGVAGESRFICLSQRHCD